MREKSNDPTPQRPDGPRLLDGPMVPIDLNALTVQIKNEQAWKNLDRNSITVYKTEGITMVLVGLHQGAEFKKNTVSGIISVQVLEGRIRFETDQESMERSKAQMVTLHENIPHNIIAVEESVFLLIHANFSVR